MLSRLRRDQHLSKNKTLKQVQGDEFRLHNYKPPTMKTKTEQQLRKRINAWLIFFIVGLVLSGITAFPLETELSLLNDWAKNSNPFISEWFSKVYEAIKDTNTRYPFMAYGTDWLAFAHIVIAVAFIGPLRDPVKNIWILEFGMIACFMVFPLAFICGNIRGIPFYWQLIDCSFGVFGFIPLYLCHRDILQLETVIASKAKQSHNMIQ